MSISIIIPVYNEQNRIVDLLKYLKLHAQGKVAEIIVVDGGSTDRTADRVRETGFTCIQSDEKGRAVQMNRGAKKSSGDILYFVHADTYPPKTYVSDIFSVSENGFESGCYRFRFNSEKWPLKVNSWFTRFNFLICRGGDQTLFIKREIFKELGGFRNMDIMEDFEMIRRLQKRGRFTVMPKDVVVSCRKYDKNAYLKTNFINLVIFLMFVFGVSDHTMVHAYKELISGTRIGSPS